MISNTTQLSIPFIDEVQEFNKTFAKTINYSPIIPDDPKLTSFVVDFIREETDELEEAIKQKNIVGILDAILDITYVCLGNATLTFGLKEKIVDGYAEIQRSNMSKACDTEALAKATVERRSREQREPCHYEKVGDKYVVYRSRDYKVMKSVDYSRPDLHQFFTEEELENAANG